MQTDRSNSRSKTPTIAAIARYWSEKDVFEFDWSTPACFGCGRFGFGNDRIEKTESAWARSGLERCHLIAHAEGGPATVENLALLCPRCHREAPMVGISSQPMIDWINRREEYLRWLIRRVTEECRAIKADLPEQCAAPGLSWDDLQVALSAMSKFLKVGLHPAGDISASVAQLVHGVVSLQEQVVAALRDQGRREHEAAGPAADR